MSVIAFDLWNRLVGLRLPTLTEVAKTASRENLRPAFPESASLFEVSKNIMAEASSARELADSRVLSISLITSHDALSPESSMVTAELPPFEIANLSTPFSATELLEHLKSEGMVGLSLSTQLDEWELHLGPLSFLFIPSEEAPRPETSKLAMVTFYYQVPGRPDLDPRISTSQVGRGRGGAGES